MVPKPKNLILEMLLAVGEQPVPVTGLVEACALFNVEGNSVRVTLSRLAAAGLVEAPQRGMYRLGDQAKSLAGDVATWRTAESRLREWNGDYATVYAGDLGRSDRPALARRERALAMLGFRELTKNVFVRPDNLEADLGALRARLYKLGLEAETPVYLSRGFDERTEKRLRGLWDGRLLTGTYRRMTGQLDEWLARAPELDVESAARESFLLGSRAIRFVVFDPLLPAPFVDAEARAAFFASVRRFDEAGHAVWRKLFQSLASAA